MAFPVGFPTHEYFKLPEGPARHALKKKFGFAKQSVFPKSFPMAEYNKLDLAGKNAMREQWWIKPLSSLARAHRESRSRFHKATASLPAAPKTGTGWAKAKEAVEAKFPRTTAGAVAFIRAWNSAEDGNGFVAKHGNSNPEFWSASTHRATFLRSKGIKLKVLKKTRGDASLYDWDLLKQVAAESGV